MAHGHGGKREGAGRPKGAAALEKEALRAVLRKKVARKWGRMLAAQISNACGIRFLVVRQKSTGKFLRRASATGETHDPDTEVIEVWEKEPSIAAFTDLANRTIDKPVEQVDMHVSGAVAMIPGRLEAARKRLASGDAQA